jgi:hypothetical protein
VAKCIQIKIHRDLESGGSLRKAETDGTQDDEDIQKNGAAARTNDERVAD